MSVTQCMGAICSSASLPSCPSTSMALTVGGKVSGWPSLSTAKVHRAAAVADAVEGKQ